MKHDTIEASHGHWREILPAVGLDPKFLTRKPGPCPLCGGEDRYTFSDRNGDGDYICRGCGAGKGLKLLMKFKGWDFKTAAHEVDQMISNLPPPSKQVKDKPGDPAVLRRLYSASQAVQDGDPVGRYLSGRGLTGPWPRALRYHPKLFWGQETHRGMLAVFFDADGNMTSMQATYLTDNGHKAPVPRPRMNMKGFQLMRGGSVRLGAVAETMGIAEGVETALSASKLFGFPVWAATSDNLLAAWQPPEGVKHVVVCGDSDHGFAGQAAAYALAKRLVVEKFEVEVRLPKLGSDWNDELQRSKEDETNSIGRRQDHGGNGVSR